MHSDHRRQYHVRPAAEVYPGDRISTDAEAIAAVNGDRDADSAVDWERVEAEAGLVYERERQSRTRISFKTSRGRVPRATYDELLVVRERSDGTRS